MGLRRNRTFARDVVDVEVLIPHAPSDAELGGDEATPHHHSLVVDVPRLIRIGTNTARFDLPL